MGSGHLRGLSLLIAILPLLLGGTLPSVPRPAPSGVRVAPFVPRVALARADSFGPLASVDSAAIWLFLTEEAWEMSRLPEGLADLSGRIRVRSAWLRAVSVQVPTHRVPELESLPGVLSVRPVRRLPRTGFRIAPSGGTGFQGATPGSDGSAADGTYRDLSSPLLVLEVPAAHALGFLGAGTRIGILDGLFYQDHVSLRGNPPVAVRDFVDQDGSVEPGIEDPEGAASHGNGLWSLISGDWPGTLTGAAPRAGVLLARVQSDADPEGADEDRWIAGLEWLETQGARIVVSGMGFRSAGQEGFTFEDLNGDVAPATRAADEAARRGVLVISPVGNGGPGPQTLQSPADGDSVLAVGSVTPVGIPSAFSALGPTADGRAKPDLLAPGEDLATASGVSEDGLENAQGTEFAGALLAGAAALFVEAYPERGPMGVLEALKISAISRQGSFYLVPRLAPAILFPDGVWALPVQEATAEGEVTTLAPQFMWNLPTAHPLGLPVTFRLDLAEDSLFQEVIIRDSVVGTFARRLQDALPPRSSLFWRVEARSVQGITWATPPQGPLTVPSWVTLDVLNDPGGAQVPDPQPEFRWTAMELLGPAGPLSFELQVFLDREGEVIQAYPGLTDQQFRIDEPLPFNVPLRWRVIAQARTGVADSVASAGPFVVTGVTNPPVTILYQNFPNPFPNEAEGVTATRIWFDLATKSGVELAVFDMRGRLVRDLIPGRGCGPVELPPGLYGREEAWGADPCINFGWDGTDDRGARVNPGVYLLRLRAAGVVEVRRVVYWP